jgi:hypothetical protein
LLANAADFLRAGVIYGIVVITGQFITPIAAIWTDVRPSCSF